MSNLHRLTNDESEFNPHCRDNTNGNGEYVLDLDIDLCIYGNDPKYLARLRDSITDWLRQNGHETDPEDANEEFDADYWDWLDAKYQVEGVESDGA